MGELRIVVLSVSVLAGCTDRASVTPSAEVQPYVCASSTIAAVTPSAAIAIAPVSDGEVVLWAPPGGQVMQQRLDQSAAPIGDPEVVWKWPATSLSAALIDDTMVVGAVSGDGTYLLGAPLGVAPYRDLTILNGSSGTSPIVVAGGDRLAPSVSYGGLLLTSFDASWQPHTSELSVLTAESHELAATALDGEAVVAWPTADDTCYFESASDEATGATRSATLACRAPRFAATSTEVVLAFERGYDIVTTRGTPATIDMADATTIAGGHSPRLVADGDRVWLSYLDPNGQIVVGVLGDDGSMKATTIPGDEPTGHELAVTNGVAQTFATTPAGLVATSVCTD